MASTDSPSHVVARSAATRLPRSVYRVGEEPDPRFSFANERTFLAWIRTALALIAAAVAIDALPLDMPPLARQPIALVAVTLGMLCAIAAWVRWVRAERALRERRPLPGLGFAAALSVGLALTAAALSGLMVT